MSDYCHLCDFDPCTCGQHGRVEPILRRTADHGGPREIDQAIREFVLLSVESGVRETWEGWLNRIADRFGPDREAVRGAWNRTHNALQQDWMLIGDPTDPARRCFLRRATRTCGGSHCRLRSLRSND